MEPFGSKKTAISGLCDTSDIVRPTPLRLTLFPRRGSVGPVLRVELSTRVLDAGFIFWHAGKFINYHTMLIDRLTASR